MASPWKFLARLVSPRRQPKQDDSTIEAVKPDIPWRQRVRPKPQSRRAGIVPITWQAEQPQPADRSDAVPAKLNRPIKLAAMLLASWKTITASWNQVLVQSCRMTAFSLPRSKRLQKPRAPSGERVSKRSKLPQSCYRFLQSLPLFPTEW